MSDGPYYARPIRTLPCPCGAVATHKVEDRRRMYGRQSRAMCLACAEAKAWGFNEDVRSMLPKETT